MKIYFSGLSEIRAIAALAVVVHHVELFKEREGIKGLYRTILQPFISGLGKNGVYLFFVLSGFLITYLLLAEQEKQGQVNVKKFYFRRILRIWPLYYLIIALCFVVLPAVVNINPEFWGNTRYFDRIENLGNGFNSTLLLFILFLPNLALSLSRIVAGASQAWSVGVEEQFYLLWPIVINRFKKNIPAALIGVIVIKSLLLAACYLFSKYTGKQEFKYGLVFLQHFNIELMAIGGLGAYLLKRSWLSMFYDRLKQMHLLIIAAVIIIGMFFQWNYILLGILFLFFIIGNTFSRSAILHNKMLASLGEVSYGIYMYHPICMYFSFCLARRFFGLLDPLKFNLFFYLGTFSFTILLSYLSFYFFERRFLAIKGRYAIVQSGR